MYVYRLSRARYTDHLSGVGAARRGARWNPIGCAMIYTAENRSLAMAEVSVHLSAAMMPQDFLMLTIDIPKVVSIQNLEEGELPPDWNVFPPSTSTQHLGLTFCQTHKYALLRVPSVVTRGEFNYLINPHHPDMAKITLVKKEKFAFDRRLFL